MIRSAKISNLTVFRQANLKFANNLNVIIGTNGTGKSHILKLLYSVVTSLNSEQKPIQSGSPTKTSVQGALAEKLVNVFQPETLGRLAKRRQGHERCDVAIGFGRKQSLEFSFSTRSKTEVQIDSLPDFWIRETAIFIPTRELLSIYPGFVSVYESHFLEFEETWRDTCVALGAPLTRGPRSGHIADLLAPLEEAMDGSIVLDGSGRFYLVSSNGRMEIGVVAEGLRKLGMIARLISSGKLSQNDYLFWDEPEANLNPQLIRQVARTIVELSFQGIQTFIATHSLFLLREIEFISEQYKDSYRVQFIGLQRQGDEVHVSQGPEISDVDTITALEEELSQSDRIFGAG